MGAFSAFFGLWFISVAVIGQDSHGVTWWISLPESLSLLSTSENTFSVKRLPWQWQITLFYEE